MVNYEFVNQSRGSITKSKTWHYWLVCLVLPFVDCFGWLAETTLGFDGLLESMFYDGNTMKHFAMTNLMYVTPKNPHIQTLSLWNGSLVNYTRQIQIMLLVQLVDQNNIGLKWLARICALWWKHNETFYNEAGYSDILENCVVPDDGRVHKCRSRELHPWVCLHLHASIHWGVR